MIIIGIAIYLIVGFFVAWRFVRKECLEMGKTYYHADDILGIIVIMFFWPMAFIYKAIDWFSDIKIKIK